MAAAGRPLAGTGAGPGRSGQPRGGAARAAAGRGRGGRPREHVLRDVRARIGDERAGSMDNLLDFLEAGPKMRKWYGQEDFDPSKNQKPEGGGPEEEEGGPEEEPEATDHVLVLGAESALGELVILKLVLARQKVVTLVKDREQSEAEWGPFVKCVQGNVGSANDIAKCLRVAKAAILPDELGALEEAVRALGGAPGVSHVVLVSAADASASGMGLMLSKLFDSEAVLSDAAREAAVAGLGLPYTIVRAGEIGGMEARDGLAREAVQGLRAAIEAAQGT